jgi:pseudouridine kinase
MHILVIGASNFDIKGRMLAEPVLASSNASAMKTSFGGVARNIAENLARLGAQVTLLTAVGGDIPGVDMLRRVGELGVDVSRALTIPDESTGTFLAALDENGDLYIGLDDLRVLRHLTPAYFRANSDAFQACDSVVFDLNLSTEALVAVTELARAYGKPMCVDPASPTLAHLLRPFLDQVDIVTPNADEAMRMLGSEPINDDDDALDAAKALVARGVRLAVITRAEHGVCFATADDAGQLPTHAKTIADTTGAGDSLTAMLVYGLTSGWGIRRSLEMGLKLAAHTLATTETVASDVRPGFGQD